MAWTTPKTWETNELVTATLLNTHLRDNVNYLFSGRPAGSYKRTAGNYSTTSATFVDVDATNMKVDLTLTGTSVLILFSGMASIANTGNAFFDVTVDGTRVGAGASGITGINYLEGTVSFAILVTGLSTGEHTFKLQYRSSSGGLTATLYGNAVNSLFAVLEVG